MTGKSRFRHDAPSALELLVFVRGRLEQVPLPPRGTITIGRSGCDVVLDDASVSRKHAALHLGDEIRIEDLGSRNGVLVHSLETGAAVASESQPTADGAALRGIVAPLRIGDRVSIGAALLMIRRARAGNEGGAPSGAQLDDGDSERGIVVVDPAMRTLYEQARRLADGLIRVLIRGESGTGKEEVARAIHAASPRAKAPLVEIDCTALPESLIEGELFGYERGSFTGASERRIGLLEMAMGGTVFIDEVGNLPPSTQVKLLRVIEDGKLRRIGGREDIALDVRFLAATNADLEAAMEAGAFRSDLLYRLSGVTLFVPPLRDRPSEVEPLARRFVEVASQQNGRADAPAIGDDVLDTMRRYAWPGNVRELKNHIECGVMLCTGDAIHLEHIPHFSRREVASSLAGSGRRTGLSSPPAEDKEEALRDEIEALRDKRYEDALRECGGNQSRAAERLGISRRTLVTWLAKHDEIPRPRKR